MNRRTFNRSLLAMIALTAGAPLMVRAQEEEIYGRQLMSREEIREHQQMMRTLEGEEREIYRREHHERMVKRAKERGVQLPDPPNGRPAGAGPERGYGPRDGGGRPEGAGRDRGYGPPGDSGRGPGGTGR